MQVQPVFQFVHRACSELWIVVGLEGLNPKPGLLRMLCSCGGVAVLPADGDAAVLLLSS